MILVGKIFHEQTDSSSFLAEGRLARRQSLVCDVDECANVPFGRHTVESHLEREQNDGRDDEIGGT